MHRHFRTDIWDSWAGRVGLDLQRLKNVVEFDNMTAVGRATERGAGIALMPELVCGPWFERGSLVRIEGFELDSNEAYYLVARRSGHGAARGRRLHALDGRPIPGRRLTVR